MDEIKADDQSPDLRQQQNLQSEKLDPAISANESTVHNKTSNPNANPYQNQEISQVSQEVHSDEKLPENPLSTPFLRPNVKSKLSSKIVTDRQLSNHESSNFSVSNSNHTDDEDNEPAIDVIQQDQNQITKTFDNVANLGNYQTGEIKATGDQSQIEDKNQQTGAKADSAADDDLIPEAMPLIMKISLLNKKEPDIYSRLKRGLQNTYNVKEPCQHNEGIENWKCLKCKGNISKFGVVFDDNQGKVSQFTKIVYENSFLQDFKDDFKSQAMTSGKPKSNGGTVLYTAYQPNNIVELKEYMYMIMCKKMKKVNKAAAGNLLRQSPFGSGLYQSLSGRLLKYLTHDKTRKDQLRQQHGDSILMFDSIFESGNLLQAEKSPTLENTYNLYMQVDTNTRGHQQWFYFKAKGGKKGISYTFNIMNFTKPGVTGGKGYKSGEYGLRIVVRSKKQQIINNNFEKWDDLTNSESNGNCEYVKTHVSRRKKDVIAAGADSDQEDWVEEAFNNNITNPQNKDQMPQINVNAPVTGLTNIDPNQVQVKPKKRRTFYYYALRFNYEFKHDDDSVYFSFSQPVTYTEILTNIHNKEKILQPKSNFDNTSPAKKPAPLLKAGSSRMKVMEEKDKEKDDPIEIKYNTTKMLKENQFQKTILIENSQKLMYYQRTELCRTLAGNPLYKIVISRDQRCARKNQIVLITSRVHSGESPGSQVFQGIYDFITSDCREAKYLRRFYTFVLVPCMNPDGVIIGNYRNSLAGVDLNRQWINPESDFHPEVCAVKNLMQEIKEDDKRQIWIFCDLHGHSKKKNSFFYGCNTAANGGFLSWTIVRLLPRIFAQKTHMFNYKDCRFKVEPYKIGTARIVAWKQFQITHSFTLENSFYGYDIGEDEDRIYTPEDYKNVGLKFTMSIYDMHFMWKQIKRELQVTHGWLKPRTLNEITGVPAAQIMHEETAQVKEDERKKKAIEQYEQFLKTFYKNSKPNFIRKKKDTQNDGKLDIERAQAVLEKSKLRERDRKVLTGTNNDKTQMSRNKLNSSKLLTQDLADQAKGEDSKTSKQILIDEKVKGVDQNIEIVVKNVDTESMEEKSKNEANYNDLNNSKEEDEKSDDDSEFMFKMHEGLVKIQALIRGFITRCRQKKKNINLANKQLNKSITQQQQNPRGSERIPRQRSNQILKKSSSRKIKIGKLNPPSQMQVGYDTSSDGGMKVTAAGTTQVNNFESSNDDQLLRSNTEKLNGKNLSDSGNNSNTSKDTGGILSSLSQFGGKKNMNIKPDWREFFEGDELDKAYQIVEVEQRDETDRESVSDESMGSNSNPSEDNFDEEEVYRNVYGVKNPEEILEIRKAKEQEFFEKVQSDVLSQQNMMNNINNIKNEDKNAKDLKAFQESAVKTNEGIKKSESEKFLKDASVYQHVNNNNQEQKTLEEDMMSQTPQRVNQDSEGHKKEMADKPRMQTSANHSPMNRQEQNQDNLFQNMTSNARRMLKSSIQQRAINLSQNQNQSNMNLGNQPKTSGQTYKMQNYSNKKENINQVIKDCFITKKMNTKGSTSLAGRQQSGQSISPQKQFQISNKKNKQFNLKMNQSLSNQFSMSQTGFTTSNATQPQIHSQTNPRANFQKQGSNRKNAIDVHAQNQQEIQNYQGGNIEEALQNQNNVLLQKIIQINLKNQNIKQNNTNRRNLQNQYQQKQTRINEMVTIQLLERLNQQMNGMNTLQANQYMQIVLMQMLQTNKLQSGDQSQNSQHQQDHGGLTEPGSQQNLQFYPTMGLETNENQDLVESSKQLMGNQVNVKRLVSDQNVPQQQANNFDTSSTPFVYNRYSNVKDDSDQQIVAKEPSVDQNKIYYNSKRKPPSASRMTNQNQEQFDPQYAGVQNFNQNQQDSFNKSVAPNNSSPLKSYLKPPISSSYNASSSQGKNIANSFNIERKSHPGEGQKFGHIPSTTDQYSNQNQYENSSVNVNVNQNSSQNLGSSLFMKYIKKKANQDQQNYQNLYVNASNLDMNPFIASQMEHNSAGLPASDKLFDINQLIMNKNKQIGLQHPNQNESVYYNDPNASKQNPQKSDKEGQSNLLARVSQQQNNTNRIHSAANQNKQGQPQQINQDIVNTKELINEIKQMRVHQQLQLQLQQQLQQQLQNQFQMQMQSNEQPQVVQFNQINYYDNQKAQVISDNVQMTKDQVYSLQNQGVVKDMMQHLNTQNRQPVVIMPGQSTHNSANSSAFSNPNINLSNQSKAQFSDTSPQKQRKKKVDQVQQVQLQSEDKIPQGLQALMNKQNNMQDMQQMIMSGYQSQGGKGMNHMQSSKRVPKQQYSSNPQNKVQQYVAPHPQNNDLINSNKERTRRAETRGAEYRVDRQQQQLIPIQQFHHNSNMKLSQPSQGGGQQPGMQQQSIRANSTYKNQNSKSQNNLTQSNQKPQTMTNNLNQQNIHFTFKQPQQHQQQHSNRVKALKLSQNLQSNNQQNWQIHQQHNQ